MRSRITVLRSLCVVHLKSFFLGGNLGNLPIYLVQPFLQSEIPYLGIYAVHGSYSARILFVSVCRFSFVRQTPLSLSRQVSRFWGEAPMVGDANVLDLVREVSAHTAEITEMSRRIGVLEGQVWWMIALLMSTLITSLASVVFSRRAANGKKATA